MDREILRKGYNNTNPEMGFTLLSDREIQVLQAKVDNLANQDIKRKLQLSSGTYAAYNRNICAKAMDMFDLLKVPDLPTALILWKAHGKKYKYITIPDKETKS